ncbi:hypothetical protein R3P38DRAFT_3236593 [Favolaschia claudopus]|uniref:Uncharacterized protein n=1 Tax=Favolaschia claudopus TaxID=2862362 RepID=A0AAV9Z9F8_9AGAR
MQFNSRQTNANSATVNPPSHTTYSPPSLPKPATVSEAHANALAWMKRVSPASPKSQEIEPVSTSDTGSSTEAMLQQLDADAEEEYSGEDAEIEIVVEMDVEELEISCEQPSVRSDCSVSLPDSSTSMEVEYHSETMSPSDCPSDTSTSSISSSFSLADLALDSSDILLDLEDLGAVRTDAVDSESESEFEFSLEQVKQEHDRANAQRIATTLMQLQRQEDEVTATIKKLRALGLSQKTLQYHISGSFRRFMRFEFLGAFSSLRLRP